MTRSRDEIDWKDPAVNAALRELWPTPLSTAAIGAALQARFHTAFVSKSAVSGAADRAGLPRRPSPVKRRDDGSRAPPPPRPIGKGATLPPLPSLMTAYPEA